tara:strand:- start:348 stop:572 length:225 start_codon:yes stop_codon:yes gene_type:complete
MVINKIVNLISKQFNLYDVMKYVKEPNDADERIDELERVQFQQGRLIEFLLKDSHPKKDFVTCSKCKTEIKEKK